MKKPKQLEAVLAIVHEIIGELRLQQKQLSAKIDSSESSGGEWCLRRAFM